MRIKIISGKSADSIAWKSVKVWIVIVMVWLTLPPISNSMAERSGGLKTAIAGRIRAARMVAVALDFQAQTRSVDVKAGDTVKEGQLLAVLESPQVEQRLERARRRLELVGLRLRGRTQGEDLLWAEQKRNAEQQSQEARVRLASYSTDGAEAAHARAEKEVAAMTRLVKEHLATAQELEAARKNLDAQTANLTQVRNTVTRLKHEVRSADSQLTMVRLQKAGESSNNDPSAQLEYEDAKVELEAAERQEKSLRVVAPSAGRVLTVAIQPGSPAGGWAPMFQIADSGDLEVEVPVTARVAQSIKAGETVTVVIPADPPQMVEAKVGTLELVPDQLQHSHLVKIPLSQPDSRFILIGMECSVEFSHGGPI